MAIYLVQHGKSQQKESDPEQSLTEEGRLETKQMARLCQNVKDIIRIQHSGKKRALQTAQIFAEMINPDIPIDTAHGINPMDDVIAFAKTLQASSNHMIVGHLPFMEKLTAYLLTHDESLLVCKFQNAGVVCLDKLTGQDNWFIKWAVVPNIAI